MSIKRRFEDTPPTNSPVFTGMPEAPTPSSGASGNEIATAGFAKQVSKEAIEATGVPTLTTPESSMPVSGIAYNNFDGGATRMIVTGGASGTPTEAELNAAGIAIGKVLQLGTNTTSRGTVDSFTIGGGGTRIIVFDPSALNVSLTPPQDLSVITPPVEPTEGSYVVNVDDGGEMTWDMDTAAPLESPALTGTPTAPTAAAETNDYTDLQLPSTLIAAVAAGGSGSDSRLPATHAANTWLESDGTNWLARDDSTARTNLGLGTAAEANTGTGVGNVLAFATADTLPALDGSALTNLPTGGAEGIPNLPLGTPAQIPSSSGVTFQDPGSLLHEHRNYCASRVYE